MQMMEYETFVGQPVRYYPLGPTHESFVGVVQGLYETIQDEALFLIYLVTRDSSIVVPAAHCTPEPIASLLGHLHNFLVVAPGGLLGIVLNETRTGAAAFLRLALDDGTSVVIPADKVQRFVLRPDYLDA